MAVKRWIIASILVIIVPSTFFMAFELINMIGKPINPEIIHVEPMFLFVERPFDTVVINKTLKNSYFIEGAAVNVTLYSTTYWENGYVGVFEKVDYANFMINLSVRVACGKVCFLNVSCVANDANSYVLVGSSHFYLDVSGATIMDIKDVGVNESEAYVCAESSSKEAALLLGWVGWVFEDENVEDHELNVKVEVAYFNGSAYKKIVIPVHVIMYTDAGNQIEKAKIVGEGEYVGSLTWPCDLTDFYGIKMKKGQTINVELHSPPKTDYDLFLYDPNGKQRSNSCLKTSEVDCISLIANITGTWYIQINCTTHAYPDDTYSLIVTMEE